MNFVIDQEPPTAQLLEQERNLLKSEIKRMSMRDTIVTFIEGEDEIIEMDRMRRMIADRMVESKRTSPHVTSFVEADVTNIVNWRRANKDKFLSI